MRIPYCVLRIAYPRLTHLSHDAHAPRSTHHEIFRNFAKLANNVFVPFPANAIVTSSSSAVNSDLSTIPWPNRP